MLVLGTIGTSQSFQPKRAIILKNKDDVMIPLILEQIPTPKQFRDAIESLSPEQQRYGSILPHLSLVLLLHLGAVGVRRLHERQRK